MKESIMDQDLKIIHVDMDAFYAAVEQRDNPKLRGKPVVVGGGPFGRGVVQTCSYEARKYGIHSAMASSRAYRLCPHAVFVPPRFDVYKSVSNQILEIFYEYTDCVEPRSLDEAYLDVTNNKKGIMAPRQIATEILERIYKETGCTASAGVSFCKFLAKVGSDFNKPNGICVITQDDAPEFIDKLPIRKFIGVGKVTEKRMKEFGIEQGSDLKKYSKDELITMFGKAGSYFYNMAWALDIREVGISRGRRSIGSERTFHEDLSDVEEIIEKLEHITERLTQRMKRYNMKGKTITLKIKYHDFKRITRSVTVKAPVDDPKIIMLNIRRLISKTELRNKKVRLVGISISNLANYSDKNYEQNTLPFEH
jgi:DNA polymerase-4